MENNRKSIKEMGSDPSEGTSHPIGKAVGGSLGAAAGAVVGAAAGPIGMVGGAAIGALAGWLEGKTIAEGINPDREMEFWKQSYKQLSYYSPEKEWEDYEPAYLMGLYSDDFNEKEWEKFRGASTLDFETAKAASRDSKRKALTSRH